MTKKKKKGFKLKSSHIAILTILILAIIIVAIANFRNAPNDESITINDCGEGTVIYKDKNICWQKSTMPLSKATWEEANNYCEDLELGDHDDWRIPTLEELRTIVEYDKTGIKINESVFEDTLMKHYWTSTEYAGKENSHYYVHFEKGHEGYSLDYNEYDVRCVRYKSIF